MHTLFSYLPHIAKTTAVLVLKLRFPVLTKYKHVVHICAVYPKSIILSTCIRHLKLDGMNPGQIKTYKNKDKTYKNKKQQLAKLVK